jgi:putative oxidoreductase
MNDVALLAARLTVGGYLAGHGAQKLFGVLGGHGLDATGAFFDKLGLSPGRQLATLAGGTELAGGVLTAVGLADPVGPVAVASTMAVAATTHRGKGPFSATGGPELALTNLAAALALAGTGPGRWSLDRLFRLRLPSPLIGVTLAAGTAATAALIARMVTSMQPAAEPSSAPAPSSGDGSSDRPTGIASAS